ncbi:uncharacterized protein LOC144348138 [Saccoglossus kowalevskii]
MSRVHNTDHTGLQAVRAIGSSVTTFLGPIKSFKCVIDDEDADNNAMVTTTIDMIQFLDIEHPVGQLFNSTCQSHHSTYGTGTTTLACMAAFLCKAVSDLLHQGIPIPVIIHMMGEYLETCITEIGKLSIPVELLIQSRAEYQGNQVETGHNDDTVHLHSNVDFKEIEFKSVSLTEKMAVENKLTKTESSCADDGHDDISWYFDGIVPDPPAFPQILDIPHLVSEERSLQINLTCHENDIKGVENSFVSHDVSLLPKLPEIPELLFPLNITPATSTNKNWDETACRSEVEKQQLTLEVSAVTSPGETNAMVKDKAKQDDSDDEFGWCFENDNLDDENKITESMESKDLNDITLKQNSVQQLRSETETTLSMSHSCQETINTTLLPQVEQYNDLSVNNMQSHRINRIENFEKLLTERLHEKSLNKVVQVHNCSRHFVSIKGIVEGKNVEGGNCVREKDTDDAMIRVEEKKDETLKLYLEVTEPGKQIKGLEQSIRNPDNSDANRFPGNMLNNSRYSHSMECSVNEHMENECITNTDNQKKGRKKCTSEENQEFVRRTHMSSGVDKYEQLERALIERACERVRPSLAQVHQRSRHFMDDELDDELKSNDEKKKHRVISDIEDLCDGLSHGHPEMMSLACDVYRRQMNEVTSDKRFDLNTVNTCCIIGPSVNDCRVEEGLIIELINGDIKPAFRHLGHKESVTVSHIRHFSDLPIKTSWLDSVTGILSQLNIGVLILKGAIDDVLMDYCMVNGIVVLQNIKYHALQTLAVSTSANILTYITDATKEDIGHLVTMECWESGWTPMTGVKTHTLKRSAYVKLVTEQLMQTVVLCAPCIAAMTGMQESLNTCLHRLQHCIKASLVIPGGGVPELIVIQCLQALTESSNTTVIPFEHVYEAPIREALQSVFHEYLHTAMWNSARYGSSTQIIEVIDMSLKSADPLPCIPSPDSSSKDVNVYDNYNVKVESWRSAWSLVQLILLSDMQIITGVDKAKNVTMSSGDKLLGLL